jgi:lipid II:glycine glycyltransferase (peptidoglycan interpeptide bridge formation enzyme)
MKRRRPGSSADALEKAMKTTNKPTIMTPKFREIKLKDLVGSSNEASPENTDDEFYEDMHAAKEKIEILLR